MITPEQLASLSPVCAQAQVMAEAGTDFVVLSKLRVRVNGQVHELDAVLCPAAHSGYATRLFLSQAFPQKGNNWTVHQLLGRKWHTWSWQGVPADLPLVQILMCHLDALR
jgi:hypothetical protein